MSFGNDVKNISEMIEAKLFPGADKEEIIRRGGDPNLGEYEHYTLKIGDYVDGSVLSKAFVRHWVEVMSKTHAGKLEVWKFQPHANMFNFDEAEKVYPNSSGRVFADDVDEAKKLFPGADDDELEKRGTLKVWDEQATANRRREIQQQHRPNQRGLATQWVAGTRDRGRASNLRVEGDVMISYQTPIAYRGDGVIYMVDQRFSVSTSKQQSYIRQAISNRGWDPVLLSVEDFKDVLREQGGVNYFGWLQEASKLFPGADDAEMEKRNKEYNLEREAAQKERIKLLGPIYKKAVEYIPEVEAAERRYSDAANEFAGNYGSASDYGVPTKISFNIKIYDYNISDEISAKLDKHILWDTFGEYIQQDREDQLEYFAEGLQETYPFIEDWGVDGRSDGWLVLELDELKHYYAEDIETLIHELRNLGDPEETGYIEDMPSVEQLQLDYNVMTGYVQAIDKRIQQISEIETEVENARKSVAKMYDDEWFDEFFANNADPDKLEERRLIKEVSKLFPGADDEEMLRRRGDRVLDTEVDELQEAILDVAQDEADKIYKALSSEWDYYISDEGVSEELRGREQEFTVDSKTGKLDDIEEKKIVYFDDLDDEDQQSAIQKALEDPYYMDYDWWEGDIGSKWRDKEGKLHWTNGYYDDELEKMGFTDTEIHFSDVGQGGGACFTATVDVKKVVQHFKIEVNERVQRAIEDGLFSGSISESGREYYSGGMDFELEYEGYDNW